VFIQVIRAAVADRDGVRREWERWERELRPGATGFLGSTAGIAADGTHVAWARFDSAENARRNSARSEQGEWWNAMSANFAGEATFLEGTDVTTMFGGGSNDAGFVQFITGRVGDPEKFKAEIAPVEAALKAHRPDLLGVTILWLDGGRFFEAAYFRSESEARAGEQREAPPELATSFSLYEDLEFIDIPEPWLA
jgi:hypothetical protein